MSPRQAAALLTTAVLCTCPAWPQTDGEPPAHSVPAPELAGSGAAASPVDTSLASTRALLLQLRGRDREEGFEYQADIMVYSQRGDSILLRGSPAVVLHGDARLEAAELVYRRSERTVEARAKLDESGQPTGAPVLTRGEEELRGARILYDLESERGSILDGRIQRDQGFYAGARIRTVTAKEFHVASGSYTTCDYELPHFDFYSPRIKVLVDEMAIARPVYLRIYQRRVLWIPFFVFSLRSERQSGLLTPSFGRRPVSYSSRETEWEISNLGYYYAPSDYWDVTLAGDLRQRSGWLARMDLAYALRYYLAGDAALQYENRQSGDQAQRAWRLDLNHSQELGEGAQLRASGAFQSNRSFNQDNSSSLQDRLNRTLRSNLSYARRWRASGNTLSISASQTRNLDTETADLVAPEISLIKARKALRPSAAATRAGAPQPWYSRVYYNGSARLRNRRYEAPGRTESTTSATVTASVSSQHRPLPFLQLSPRLTETWQDADLRQSAQPSRRSDQVGATASLSQTFYGVFPTRVWHLLATRHEFKPDLSFSFEAARADTGGLLGFGGDRGSWTQNRRIVLRADNSLWAKLEHQGSIAKVRLAQINLSSGYDFENKTRPLADLTTVVSVAAGRLVDSRLTMRATLYDDEDRLRLSDPRLRQLELNTNVRYTRAAGPGHSPAGTSALGPDDVAQAGSGGFSPGPLAGLGQETFASRRSAAGAAASGARLSLSHYYTRTRYGASTTKRSWLRCGMGLGVGTAQYHRYSRTKWHIDYSVNYNLHDPRTPTWSADRVTAELLSVQRDFHDWSATLQVAPTSFRREPAFYFRAQLRDIPQLKFERGDARL